MVPLNPSSPIEFVRRFVRSGRAIPVSPSAKEPRMNNIVAQQMACTYQPQNMVGYSLEFYHVFDLVPIPLKPKSKVPLARWSHVNLKPAPVKIEAWVSKLDWMDIKTLVSYKIGILVRQRILGLSQKKMNIEASIYCSNYVHLLFKYSFK